MTTKEQMYVHIADAIAEVEGSRIGQTGPADPEQVAQAIRDSLVRLMAADKDADFDADEAIKGFKVSVCPEAGSDSKFMSEVTWAAAGNHPSPRCSTAPT